MPKVPRYELERHLDPDSEDFSPTNKDLAEEQGMESRAIDELTEIELELADPSMFDFDGDERKFNATDPENIWGRLASLQRDFRSTVKDPDLRKKLDARILKIEQKVYKQYVPFIESRINRFGFLNSPLENAYGGKLSASEAASYFAQARSVMGRFKISEKEQIDFLSELDRLQEKLERYRSELTLFTFERIEEELQKEIFSRDDYDSFERPNESVRTFGNEDAEKRNRLKFDLMLAKAHSLKEIASKMLNESTRKFCEERARSLFEYVEYLKEKSEAPRELFAFEAELKDLFQRVKDGEKISAKIVEQASRKLSDMKEKRLWIDYGQMIRKLEKLLKKINRVISGETVEADDDRFEVDRTGINWAWDLIGVERGASKEKIKEAHRQLVLKYHPDRNKNPESERKMKDINEAYELIRRVENFK
ncbi:DnaJ domain-containing protein [Candidatus Uhrbacteria bacterium]|nr:DnaJ domain-containing protein [Candidatus Uhrbacteria bacterium]